MDAARREWLETLVAACERAAAELNGHRDRTPSQNRLLEDIRALRARLEADLHGEGEERDT